MNCGLDRPDRRAERKRNERGESKAYPKDWLGEQRERTVAIPCAFGLFQHEIAARDPSEEREFRDALRPSGLHRTKDRASQVPEQPERCKQPRGLQMAMGDRTFGTGERGQCVRTLVYTQNADTSQENRIYTEHVSIVGERDRIQASHLYVLFLSNSP